MALTELQKCPFPYFGGKRHAAPIVWQCLGDVNHYVEPFAGSLAVLLERPHVANRPYHSETVNDADGLLVNAWRAIQLHPDATAEAASNPVAEADLHARHLALVRWRESQGLERLMADPAFCDPVMAGWWMWGISSWIGSGWCDGKGAWTEVDGIFQKQPRGEREPRVANQCPYISDNGKGVNHAGTREPGVANQRPCINSDGSGVNHPGTREPGVANQLPCINSNGSGVNHAGTRERGIEYDHAYHPITMPELRRWFAYLSARLRHVRILNGDWARVVTTGAAVTLPVRKGGVVGIFVDPPYADTADRSDGLYAHESLSVAHDVREWCLRSGDDRRFRIILAGFDGEHGTELTDAGWREVEWFTKGHLRGGMALQGADGTNQHKERLWVSPHCLGSQKTQVGMFEGLQE